MLVKFCEEKYNLVESCQTVSLGTLQSYSNDDPDFLRYDYNEGKFLVSNFGDEMDLSSSFVESLTQGGIIGGGMKLDAGATFKLPLVFPNCYIYCMSENVIPNLENAQKIDPSYGSWFAIENLNNFIRVTSNLLYAQLRTDDLILDNNPNIDYLRNIRIQVEHRPVVIRNKEEKIDPQNVESSVALINNPIDLLFYKEPQYEPLREYRVAFIITDGNGMPIPVKAQSKILSLMPELGVSKIEVK